MSALNWQKNLGYYSIIVPVAPSSMLKLLTPLATIFVEMFFQKKIWWGFGPTWVTPWKDFLITWKNGVLKFFERVFRLDKFSGSCLNLQLKILSKLSFLKEVGNLLAFFLFKLNVIKIAILSKRHFLAQNDTLSKWIWTKCKQCSTLKLS